MLKLLFIAFLVQFSQSQKCHTSGECERKWPQAECNRARCRCPPNTLRKPCASRGWVCLSIIDAVSGQSGPPLTCPTPEGAGYQVIYRENGNVAMCSTKSAYSTCPSGYECIQGLSILDKLDGVCCPNPSTSCSQPIFDHEDGNLQRWGFDGAKCIVFKWNPEKPSSANNFKTSIQCEDYCIKEIQYCIGNFHWIRHADVQTLLLEFLFISGIFLLNFFLRVTVWMLATRSLFITRCFQTSVAGCSEAFKGFIPTEKIEKRFSLSSGPGGQHVQKNATKAEIRFKLSDADWLPSHLKDALQQKLWHRINSSGELIIESERTREQKLNVADCFDKLRFTIYEVQRELTKRAESEEDTAILRKKAERAAQHRLAEKRKQSEKLSSRHLGLDIY